MGEHTKQLLPWKNTTLLGHAIQQANSISDSICVVLGAEAAIIQKTLPKTVETIINPDWENGMGSSIAAGVAYFQEKAIHPDGLLIMLVDQPLLDHDYLKKLCQGFNKEKCKIVATAYGERFGVPAIFDSSLFSELCKLNQDFGAKHIIAKYKNEVVSVYPNGREVDIDTIETYNQLIDL